MKLIDLLVKDLPGLGGWRDGFSYAAQDKNGDIFLYEEPPALAGEGCWWADEDSLYLPLNCESSDDWNTAVITREQYEAALAEASKPVWDGKGFPPVGCECEIFVCEKWFRVRIKYIGDAYVVTHRMDSGCEVAYCVAGRPDKFRPIRTDEQRKREEAINKIDLYAHVNSWSSISSGQVIAIYEAIAAGKIPGVRLEDEAGR